MQTFLGIVATIGLLAFIVFTFRQGFSVKSRKGDNSATDATSLIVDRDLHRP